MTGEYSCGGVLSGCSCEKLSSGGRTAGEGLASPIAGEETTEPARPERRCTLTMVKRLESYLQLPETVMILLAGLIRLQVENSIRVMIGQVPEQ